LQKKRESGKRPCGLDKIFCMKCRLPQRPAGSMVDFVQTSTTSGNLTAICPACESMMFRRASLVKLGQFRGYLDITLPQALRHIGESNQPSVNSDFNSKGETSEKVQRSK